MPPTPGGRSHPNHNNNSSSSMSTTLQEDVFNRIMNRMQQPQPPTSGSGALTSRNVPPRNRAGSQQQRKQSSSSQQQQKKNPSAMEDLPNLIASLKDALTPRDDPTRPRHAVGHSAAFLQSEKEREREASRKALQQARISAAAHSSDPGTARNLIKAVTVAEREKQKGSGGDELAKRKAQEEEEEEEEERNDAVAEVEQRIFGGGPVPSSLRSVVSEVRQEVESRLKLADVGTFRTCVQSLFECRSLIDQVLKQMPSHWHFRDESLSVADDNNNGDESAAQKRQHNVIQHAAQQKLLGEMMEDCRRGTNVLIPTGQYATEPVSGRVEVVSGRTAVQVRRQSGSSSSPGGSPRQMMMANTPGFSRGAEDSSVSVTPPHTANHQHHHHQQHQHQQPLSPAFAEKFQQQQFQLPPLSHFRSAAGQQHHHLGAPGDSGVTSSGTLANALRLLDPDSEHQQLLRHLRRQTQTMSSGSQTDTFMQDDLSREDFEFQGQRVKEQAVLIKEYEGAVQRLRNQLRVAQGALATRSGTVTYIRETLFKECGILRTQLQVMQQYFLNQQQQQAQTASSQQQQGGMSSPISDPQMQQQQQQLLGRGTSFSNNTNSPRARSQSFLSASMMRNDRSDILPAGLSSYAVAPTPMMMNNANNSSPPGVSAGAAAGAAASSSSSTASPLIYSANQRPAPYSTLALQPLAPVYSLLDTILLAVENEQTIATSAVDGTVATEPSKDSQLRDLRGLFAQQQAHWKRETADARRKFNLAMAHKNEQLRRITLASNVKYLRGRLLELFSDFRHSFTEFKGSVRAAMKLHSNFVARASRDLEFGVQKAAGDLEQHNALVKERRALKDVIAAVPDLVLPSLSPEFAMGYHSWPFSDANEPLKAYAASHYGTEMADRMAVELDVLHNLFVEVQRFGVRVHQLPDVHRPKPGWLLAKVAQGLLRSPQSTSDLAAQIRTLLERDDALAKQQAKVNIAIHGVIIRRKVLADRIREALREGGIDCAAARSAEATLGDLTSSSPWNRNSASLLAAINATYTDIPTCASRFNQFAEDIDMYHIKRMKLQQQRMDNARQLFQLWRSSGIDVTGGRYAIVSRDPDGPWAAGMVKTRRLRGPRTGAGFDALPNTIGEQQQQQQQRLEGGENGAEPKPKVTGRYGASTGASSPIKIQQPQEQPHVENLVDEQSKAVEAEVAAAAAAAQKTQRAEKEEEAVEAPAVVAENK